MQIRTISLWNDAALNAASSRTGSRSLFLRATNLVLSATRLFLRATLILRDAFGVSPSGLSPASPNPASCAPGPRAPRPQSSSSWRSPRNRFLTREHRRNIKFFQFRRRVGRGGRWGSPPARGRRLRSRSDRGHGGRRVYPAETFRRWARGGGGGRPRPRQRCWPWRWRRRRDPSRRGCLRSLPRASSGRC